MASEKASLVRASTSGYGAIKKEPSYYTPQQVTTYFTKRDFCVVSILSGITIAAIATALAFGIPALNAKREQYLNLTIEPSPSELQTFKDYVVATDADYCAQIGEEALAKGGSAVDAAIATLFCNGVVHPDAMGIGGGVLLTIYDKASKNFTVIDGRETAPSRSESIPEDKLETGSLSIAVPGEIRAYETAHQMFGKLPWADLVQPTIDMCNEGFMITKHLADKLESHAERLNSSSSLRSQFYNSEKQRFYQVGEVMKCEQLAATLTTIRDEKAAAFYEGSIAQQLVDEIAKEGGNLTLEDFANYTVRVRNPIQITLPTSGATVFSPPTPGGGPILSLILNIMDGFQQRVEDSTNDTRAALMYHRLLESFKFAFAAKTHLSDEDFVEDENLVKKFISSQYAEEIRKKIDNITHPPEFYDPLDPLPEDKGTAHVSVLTANGTAVSATSSINSNFGSYVRSPSTGIILNNHMSDFTSKKGTPNSVEIGKRPLSSMVPTIVVDSATLEPILVLGGAGHTRITTGVAQIVFRHLYLKQNVKEAIDHPRLHHQLTPNEALYQPGFPGILVDRLRLFGHEMNPEDEPTAFTAISKDNNGLHANVDYRRGGGSAAGQ